MYQVRHEAVHGGCVRDDGEVNDEHELKWNDGPGGCDWVAPRVGVHGNLDIRSEISNYIFAIVMIISVARMHIQLGKLRDTSSTNEIT